MRPALLLATVLPLLACVAYDAVTTPDQHDGSSPPPAAGSAAAPYGRAIYALDQANSLIVFASDQANRVLGRIAITGLGTGEQLVGLDFRPSDLNDDGANNIGKLYGVSTAGRVYVIDPATGAATNGQTLQTAAGVAVTLRGTSFGIGFNPAVDRLRIHSDQEQNLAVNVDNGVTAVNAGLAYATGDPNGGRDPRVVGTAYTNSDADPATGTELYAIDAARDVLVRLATPADGQLATVGALGVDTGDIVGFDIVGTTGGTAYATLTTSPSGKPTLYAVDLMSGAATPLRLMAQSEPLVSVAVAP
jgi:hypothetical protein